MLKVRKNDPEPTPEGGGDAGENQEQRSAMKQVTRNALILGAVEVVLGVLIYFDLLGLLSNLHLHWRIHTAMGFPVTYMGAWLLYWCGKLWQQADDPERWRQTASQMIGKYRSSPALLPVVAVGLVMLEWTLRGTAYMVFLLMELVPLELMLFPLLWEMRRL